MNFASTFSNFIPVLRIWNNTVISRFPASPDIFITIDDSPNQSTTDEVLYALVSNNMHASFFIVGERAKQNPDIVEKILSLGFDLENHSYSHRRMIFYPSKKIELEIQSVNEIIRNLSNKNARYFRPPYGHFDYSMIRQIKKMNQKILLWNRMPAEFVSSVSIQRIRKYFVLNLQAGDIIVLHDNEKTKNKIGKVINILAEVMEMRQLKSSKLPPIL